MTAAVAQAVAVESAAFDADPGRSEFLRVRGLRYHLRCFNRGVDAPLLFFLHGWLDVSASWAPVIARLSSRFTVIAPDWRGLGYSQWACGGYWFYDYLADFDAIADYYAPERRFVLAGHSMGAQVASLYAGLRPRRVTALALLDALMLPEPAPARAVERIDDWLTQLRQPMTVRSYVDFEALAQRIAAHHPRLSPAAAAFAARCWGRRGADGRVYLLADPRHYLRGPLSYRNADAEPIWRRVEAPTLILRAGESEYREAVPATELERRYACFHDRRVETLAGVGHMLHFEAPQTTADALAGFLEACG